MTSADSLEAGHQALREGRWTDALVEFETALDEQETAEALEGIADACWWLCDAPASVRYRERAWVRFREGGDVVRAGRAAVDLAIHYLVNLGNDAAARGWLGRAERVLRNADPNPLRGWLWLMQGYLSFDPRLAHELYDRALALAQESGDVDLELVALSDLGLSLVAEGRPDEGLSLLDEAMAGTLGGEYHRLDTVVFASCSMLAACHLAGDLGRARQWCRVADEFMHTYGCPFLYARCRTHYGGVLVAAGQWAEGEDQLQAALRMSQDTGPGPRLDALAQLAELRLRQGRLEDAESLLALTDNAGEGTLAAATVHLARGKPSLAAGLLERRTMVLGERHIETAATLALLVEALLASGELVSARDTVVRLRALADLHERGPARALAALAAGRIAATESRTVEAIDDLERALQNLAPLHLPFETARVRIELARLLVETEPQRAVTEATGALATFEQLGAAADTDAAAALLRALGAPARTGPKNVGLLTAREQDVLGLVAIGLSNPEIAQRLYISRKTASNHVSNILTKLGLRNRAEVVAYAARQPYRPPDR